MPQPRCRFCHTSLEQTFVDLGLTPLANTYLEAERVSEMEPFYPLHIYVCAKCFLVQHQTNIQPDHLFTQYAYFSSYSDSWLAHARSYVAMAHERFALDHRSRVIEVASNDGYLLQYFVERGIPVLGVEAAENVSTAARSKGIPTLNAFFGERTAHQLVDNGETADLLIGNNVLAHVPDLNDFVRGLKLVVKPHGVITLEFPHLLQLMVLNQFDTIYHEHYSYFSFITVERVLGGHGLTVFDVEELSTHGGSLRIYACHREDSSRTLSGRVHELRAREEAAGFTRVEHYQTFAHQVAVTKRNFLKFLISAKEEGKTIVGYGAPAKGNTLLNYCGVRTDFIEYTVDRSPHKQGRFLPGTHIPVYHPDMVNRTKPDYLVILPWNLKDEIIRQMSYIREWGGQFLVPIPEVTVYP